MSSSSRYSSFTWNSFLNPRLSNPLYFLVAAARERSSLTPVAPALSVFADRGDWMYQDYVKVFKDLTHHAALNKELQAKLAERDAEIAKLKEAWWKKIVGK